MKKDLKLKTQWPAFISKLAFGIDFALSQRLPDIIEDTDRKVVVITDHDVEKLLTSFLEHLDVTIFSFPSGEIFKTRETKAMLEDNLMSHNFGRDSLIVGLGGGVVCDIAGFLASTYCRGVPLIQIPTTLLAMVDASVGGKNGVNTPYGKNLIGTFYPPEEVLIDGSFLATLPMKQRINGIVEIIKSGLIASPALFTLMKTHVHQWESNDLEFIMERIYESVVIKKEIVEQDPEEEEGIRRCLNLGHTFGHAIEILGEFTIEHGEAIAIGILVSCYISHKMGLLPQEDFYTIKEIFLAYQLPLQLHHPHSLDDLMNLLARDKKAIKASPRLVLLESIGCVAPFGGQYCTEVDFPLLEEAIDWMNKEFSHG